MGPDEEVLARLLATFAIEAREWTETITRLILGAERQSDPAALAATYESLARLLHNLKGTSATIGLAELSELAHALEDVLVPHGRGPTPLPSEVADALLGALDTFMARLRATLERSEVLPSIDASLAVLRALSLPSEAAPQHRESDEDDPRAGSAPTSMGRGEHERRDRAEPEPAVDGSWRVEAKQVVALMREVEQLREIRLRLDDRKREIAKGLAELAALDLPRSARELAAIFGRVEQALASDAEETAGVVEILEDGLKEICTVPVRTIIEPLFRLVRDQCRSSGKEVSLSSLGMDVALDRRVLEVLKRALLHLIRNAVDHGIETPDVRQQRGKHREGALVIRTELHGNMAFFEVADDGGGLDTARIREVAAARGVVPAATLANMDDTELHQLVFVPRFSTKREVTETSGRGVGLDVVRTEIEALGGSIGLQSIAGQGTRFLLTLPVELGSSAVVVVRFGEYQLGLPAPGLDVIVGASAENVRVDDEQMRLVARDDLVALFDLGALLGARQPQAPIEAQPILVVASQGRRAAIAVDEVLGDWDLVIRPLPLELRDVPAYQGVASSATGDILMVLRIDWLVTRHASMAAGATKQRALVVDDALTVRALHRAVLEAAGFVVHATGSGREALERARSGSYDVVICDIEMPDMDGYQVTEALRSRPATRAVPIILVSTHDTEVERERGRASGADAFVSKKDCEGGHLLAIVSSAMARRSATSS